PPPPAAAPPVAPRVASRGAAAPPAAPAPGAIPAEHTGITGEISIDEAPSPTPVPRKRNVAYAEELADKYATREFTLSTPAGKGGKRPGKGHKLLFTLAFAGVLVAAL